MQAGVILVISVTITIAVLGQREGSCEILPQASSSVILRLLSITQNIGLISSIQPQAQLTRSPAQVGRDVAIWLSRASEMRRLAGRRVFLSIAGVFERGYFRTARLEWACTRTAGQPLVLHLHQKIGSIYGPRPAQEGCSRRLLERAAHLPGDWNLLSG
jgi:hypothetical protein